jgi:hypothetical protein
MSCLGVPSSNAIDAAREVPANSHAAKAKRSRRNRTYRRKSRRSMIF